VYGRFHRASRRVQREIRGHLAVGGDVARLDAGARHDPLVGGVDAPLELAVRHDALGQVAAGADNSRVEHEACPGREGFILGAGGRGHKP